VCTVQVVKLKGLKSVKGWCHYFAIISRVISSSGNDDDCVDSVILGIDVRKSAAAAAPTDDNCDNTDDVINDDDDDEVDEEEASEGCNEDVAATVGLVLPITTGLSVTMSGQGYVCTRHTLVVTLHSIYTGCLSCLDLFPQLELVQ